MLEQNELEKIVLEAYNTLKDSTREWIETEQLFIDLYGDNYLVIKRDVIDKR